jgi:HK97 family phage portal protein
MPAFFGSLARRWREQKAVTFAPGFWEALRSPAKSGATVNATSALECTTALACVQAIACGVAMLPLDIYRPREGGGRDVATDEPLWEFFAGQPNEWQTWPEWIETTLMHAVLCGDGISFINRPNPRGLIRELIPLVPASVSVEQRQGYDLLYHLVLADGRSLTVGREQVFHLRAPSWNAYSGLDATKLAREAIGLALATEEAHARLHANGARPGGILTTEQRLTREQVDELRAAWQQTQGGLSNAMRTAVLSSGLKWEPMGMTGVDAQHIETRRFQIEEICRAFGVYPAMVGHSRMFFGTHAAFSRLLDSRRSYILSIV